MKMTAAEKLVHCIIEALERGTIPWVKPWNALACHNAVSKREYTGINQLVLTAAEVGNRFLTHNQLTKLGGTVGTGTSVRICFMKPMKEKKNKAGEITHNSFLMRRFYNVFPVSKIEGLPDRFYNVDPSAELKTEPNHKADELVAATSAEIVHFGGRALYSPSMDKITMPERGTFYSNELYYVTLFHELGHWTGHTSRLNRKDGRAPEELIAELSAGLLCPEVGIDMVDHINNTAEYCRGWANSLRNMDGDKPFERILRAASKAQKASGFILDCAKVADVC